MPHIIDMNRFILCRSDSGDGGWSLHAPGSTDEEIAQGDAPPLASGASTWDAARNDWDRPNADDYAAAHSARVSSKP